MMTYSKRAQRNIDWIEKHCRIPEGLDYGRPVKLRDWQKEIIERIYGNPSKTRRAIISFGRKNAKTTLSAFLLLLHLCGPERKPNSQLFSAAQSREQAGLLFSLASKIVRLSPVLDAHIAVRETAKVLACEHFGTVYRALSAEATTAYGLSPSFIVHDELGQVKGPRSSLYEALETATGAQADPLSIIISTQAATNNDLLSVLIDDALAGKDPRVVVALYTASEDLDPFSQEAIRAANPAFGDFLNATEVMAMADDARRMPARQAEFENLVLNRRVEASAPFVSRPSWALCSDPALPFGDFTPVYGGLDLSSVNDLTALVLVGKVKDKWQVHPTFWLPGDTIHDHARSDRVPYDLFHKQGFLKAAPGKTVDYDFVAGYIRSLFDLYNIKRIAFDSWGFGHLRPCLVRAGFPEDMIETQFLEFGQGFKSMSPALHTLEAEILNMRLNHGDHPVLKLCAANAVVQMDPAGNRKLTKAKSSGRIDGMVALAMAMSAATQDVGEMFVTDGMAFA